MGAYLSTLAGCFSRPTFSIRHTQQTNAYHEVKAPVPAPSALNEKGPLNPTTTELFTALTPTNPTKADMKHADEIACSLQFSRTIPVFHYNLSIAFAPPPSPIDGASTTSWIWTPTLALAILRTITAAIETGLPLGVATEALEKATQDVEGWVGKHPVMAGVVAMIVALGVLVVIAPWVVEGLGFGGLGVRLGSFAARWQSMYGGATPGGSLFSFLQRMGMVGW